MAEKNIFVLIKQVPDQSAKAGINPDGTIDRAKAKRMMNFCRVYLHFSD